MRNLNRVKFQALIIKDIKELGYSVENKYVQELIESAVEFAEISTKDELKDFVQESLELIPSNLLQGDVI